MYKEIIGKAVDITNIRGRYTTSAALLDLEVERILGSRDFASSYGKSEWLAEGKTYTEIEVQEGEYKKMVVCLEDGSMHDITDQVSTSNMTVGCPKIKSLTISISCGIISISSEIPIIALRSIYKKSMKENKEAFISEHSSMLVAYLRWQLLGDIDAKSSALGYNMYIQLLRNLSKLPVVT